MSQNIRVVCRLKPSEDKYIEVENNIIKIQRYTESIMDKKLNILSFGFDDVLLCGQEEFYNKTVKSWVNDILDGYNCTIFAYGQTCSGKTYTMSGYSNLVDNQALVLDSSLKLWNSSDQMGIIPRMIYDLLKKLKEKTDIKCSIKLSYTEIYMEKIKDLLNPHNSDLSIREDKANGIYIENVTCPYVTSFDQIYNYMKKGEINRTVMSTKMNSDSSRSHAVLSFNIIQEYKDKRIVSKLTFIDLAGSESIEKAQTSGITLEQGKYINKSLSSLGNVINHLVKDSAHIPYRDSKLTRILSDSLGGNSKTCLILTISSDMSNLEETVSTLRFGTSAKKIKNQPKKNIELTIEEYKKLLFEANQRIEQYEKGCVREPIMILPSPANNENNTSELLETIEKKSDEIQLLIDKLQLYFELNNKLHMQVEDMKIRIIEYEIKNKQQEEFIHQLTSQNYDKTKIVGDYDHNLKLLESYKIQIDFLKKQNSMLMNEHRKEISKLNKDIIKLKEELNIKSISSADDNFMYNITDGI